MSVLAPIILFAYNRPDHTEQTLKALQQNELANQSTLYIFCDGAKAQAEAVTLKKIEEVRAVVRSQKWCKEVQIIERTENWGLAKSIIIGVTEIIKKHGKVIVLEDDLITSKGFLKYMNDALNMYEQDEAVMHITGYLHPIGPNNFPETFFFNQPSSWGWGTWQRAWKHLNTDTKYLMKSIKNKRYFDLDGSYPFYSHLRANLTGELNTWAIKWQASIHLKKGLTLYPNQSLVQNIGWDGSGANCEEDELMMQVEETLAEKIEVKRITLVENTAARQQIKAHFDKMIPKKAFISKVKWRLFDLYQLTVAK